MWCCLYPHTGKTLVAVVHHTKNPCQCAALVETVLSGGQLPAYIASPSHSKAWDWLWQKGISTESHCHGNLSLGWPAFQWTKTGESSSLKTKLFLETHRVYWMFWNLEMWLYLTLCFCKVHELRDSGPAPRMSPAWSGHGILTPCGFPSLEEQMLHRWALGLMR